MHDNELWATLALSHLPGLGPVRFARLREAGPLSALFEGAHLNVEGMRRLRALGVKPLLPQAAIARDWDWGQVPGHFLLSYTHKDYPVLLREIPSPPPMLYVQGSLQGLQMPALAIVGSRQPTPEGKQHAYQFAQALCAEGYAIISGLAKGIDTAAHAGACAVKGCTVAVLGHGLDTLYPAENRRLADAIVARGGALVSEFPLGVGPARTHFPRRNRIISGLSRGVVVIEAAEKSGSLITVDHALAQGREVFALPGAIHAAQSKGCHQLIREGATLVEHVGHIREGLAWAAISAV